MHACLLAGNTLQRRYNRREGVVNQEQACLKQFSPLLRSCEGRASLFMCGKQPLCAQNTLKRRFDFRGGAEKHVQACLSTENTLQLRSSR